MHISIHMLHAISHNAALCTVRVARYSIQSNCRYMIHFDCTNRASIAHSNYGIK